METAESLQGRRAAKAVPYGGPSSSRAQQPERQRPAAPASTSGRSGERPQTSGALRPKLRQQRLTALATLLAVAPAEAEALIAAMPALLQHDSGLLKANLAGLSRSLAGDQEAVRAACRREPLLLVLPARRVRECVDALAAATFMSQKRAAAVVLKLPVLATLAPATLSNKLQGLEEVLCGPAVPAASMRLAPGPSVPGGSRGCAAVPVGPSQGSAPAAADTLQLGLCGAHQQVACAACAIGEGGRAPGAGKGSGPGRPPAPAAAGAASRAGPAQQEPMAAQSRATVLAAAVQQAPRLLTFSTDALREHRAQLCALLGGPERTCELLRREPWLLEARPSKVAAKLQLLRHLLGCPQHPAALSLLLHKSPALLQRSVPALSRTVRALSIWRLEPRCKLRIVLSHPELLQLSPEEMHGRCRWLRRLLLSSAYYHSTLRRLPPRLLGLVIQRLPLMWPRLQYLADSSQEGAVQLMAAVECDQANFESRFPGFAKWHAWKLNQLVSDRAVGLGLWGSCKGLEPVPICGLYWQGKARPSSVHTANAWCATLSRRAATTHGAGPSASAASASRPAAPLLVHGWGALRRRRRSRAQSFSAEGGSALEFHVCNASFPAPAGAAVGTKPHARASSSAAPASAREDATQQDEVPGSQAAATPVVMAEAGEVRSGRVTVVRPRRVLPSFKAASEEAGGGGLGAAAEPVAVPKPQPARRQA